MKKTGYDLQVYYRIIALWVLCEAMLGGIIHAFHIPVSGLIVGSAAVICICLIAYYVPVKGAIIKATIIVAIFKMMLSPQAPVLAYAAVFFQGGLGELLFWRRKFYRVACVLMGFLALLESGFQRIIVLTIVYGNNFWKAINSFFNDLSGQKNFTDYSFYFITGYVLIHVTVGLTIGWWAGVIPQKILNWQIQFALFKMTESKNEKLIPGQIKKRKRLKTGLLIIWLALIMLYIQSYFQLGNPLLPPELPFQILVRSFIVILSWYFLIAPLSGFLLQSWLRKKKKGGQREIERIAALLPSTRKLLKESWGFASGKKGGGKIIFFSKLVLAKSLIAERRLKKIVILTGNIHTGKTTSLMNWIDNRDDVYGILTPVINDKRIFLDVETKLSFPMEADKNEDEVIFVGRHRFIRKNFEKAGNIISMAQNKGGWLIIDEIGPLELRKEGFYDVLPESLQRNDQNVLLVVRATILEEVINQFGLEDAVIINSVTELENVDTRELALV
jgi:nucleoside-triphosphatase THEP1